MDKAISVTSRQSWKDSVVSRLAGLMLKFYRIGYRACLEGMLDNVLFRC